MQHVKEGGGGVMGDGVGVSDTINLDWYDVQLKHVLYIFIFADITLSVVLSYLPNKVRVCKCFLLLLFVCLFSPAIL